MIYIIHSLSLSICIYTHHTHTCLLSYMCAVRVPHLQDTQRVLCVRGASRARSPDGGTWRSGGLPGLCSRHTAVGPPPSPNSLVWTKLRGGDEAENPPRRVEKYLLCAWQTLSGVHVVNHQQSAERVPGENRSPDGDAKPWVGVGSGTFCLNPTPTRVCPF